MELESFLLPDTSCTDCPRKCGVMRPLSMPDDMSGERMPGICHSPLNPVVARAGLHFWEEPVISGVRGSGAVFFTGCNLHCVFCQNYEISSCGRGSEISVTRLREIYFELIAKGAHNINLVTPQHFTRAILASLEGDPIPVPVVWNSNGYDSVETLRKLEGKVRIFLPDLKYADNELARRYGAAPDYFETATAAIREMYRQTGPYQVSDDGILQSGVIIRHLLLPGHVANTLAVMRWVEQNFKPGEVMFSLMRQYIPCGRVSDTCFSELNRKVSDAEYEMVESALFRSSIEDGFVQEEPSASKEFIPSFDGTGV